MKSISAAAIAAASLLMAVPNNAAAYGSHHGVRVNPVSDAVFEVVGRGGNGYLFWCGAADYAQRVLQVPWSSELHISRGLGTSETTGRRSAVQFTLDANLAPDGSLRSVNSLQAGDRMSVQKAFEFCFVPFGRI
ncbi:hypothetical protein RA19_21970 [Leisingera sp. ANG-M1]|uniref:hypothetical protein n=1 Tax=Leisingera sp. ANG-M1 TaxID=1577895 RepID=UPI00057CF80D|nr:hypothetical protein [Leisingera sp. ANG-M1]KIC07797.1 hypothetical protein RA19_21970 [Leisingera sp. ANG-M1]